MIVDSPNELSSERSLIEGTFCMEPISLDGGDGSSLSLIEPSLLASSAGRTPLIPLYLLWSRLGKKSISNLIWKWGKESRAKISFHFTWIQLFLKNTFIQRVNPIFFIESEFILIFIFNLKSNSLSIFCVIIVLNGFI